MLQKQNQSGESYLLKLVDFGLSQILLPEQKSRDPFGTMGYVAPEVLLQKPYSESVDAFSLGVIVYVMLSGMLPFDSESNKEIARLTINEQVPFKHKLWDYVSHEAKVFIFQSLKKNSHERISIKGALQDPWVCKKS